MDVDIEQLVDQLREPEAVKDAVRRHLVRQIGLPAGLVRWSDGTVHRVGEDTDDDG